jgi:hypothetical protein
MTIPPLTAQSPEPARDVATRTFQAIVFREILKPLAAALGPVGDIATSSVADALFARRKP